MSILIRQTGFETTAGQKPDKHSFTDICSMKMEDGNWYIAQIDQVM
ncbi:MAG: hypothetical protein JW874_09160 [Spirochaetales bacterium]|nr:hypothetical protein [Spirochaetales bacterium]